MLLVRLYKKKDGDRSSIAVSGAVPGLLVDYCTILLYTFELLLSVPFEV